MAKVRFEGSLDKMIFEVRGGDSYNDMEGALLDHCAEKMGMNHPDIVVEYPVYYRELIDAVNFIHIGYVQLGIDKKENVYTTQHLTLERKKLKNHWHPFYFYKGECEYGFKRE
ncbi:hypothetical protein BJ925_0327 [Rahnella aquatilis]|nr:hypothetical protein BJ925_0327 [Rahnella aquatilis]